MAAKTSAEKKTIMENAAQKAINLTATDDWLAWYSHFFAKLSAVALGQIIMGEGRRRADAKATHQRKVRERANKALEEATGRAPGYSEQDFADRGYPQKGSRGTWSRERKALEDADKEIKREEAEGIEWEEGAGERAPA